MVERILNAMESESSANTRAISKKISLLDSILTVDQAWRAMKSDGIVNCCRKENEEDVLNDVKRMYSSDNSDEHEADVGFQEESKEVTPSSRRDMLLAVQTLRKGLLFRNADQWSLLCKLDDAVEQATKHEVKQSKIEQFFCAAEAEEQK